ncbi:MAG: beta-lactamase family protein [Rhodobacteraceae bacterium]|nr:beta-lactamase family protein [Paracoccaceae bacterium]
MYKIFRWLARIFVVLVVAALAIGVWKRDELLRLWTVQTMFDADKIVRSFSTTDRAFLTVPVNRGAGPVSPLPEGPTLELPERVQLWVNEFDVTSLVVVHRGEIVHESYLRGTKADDRRILWSISKSYLSALVGILIDEGQIESIDIPVTRHAPSLIGTAYDGATLRDVLQMSSGVVFDEDYLDYNSDINRMARVVALGGLLDDFTTGLNDTFRAPGTAWQYVSIDTHVIGMVVRGATGRDVPGLLSEKVIAPLGQEDDGFYLTDGAGVAFVLGGLNLRSRDLARFGVMIEQDGLYQGRRVVPAAWIAEATAASAATRPDQLGYGFQWWIPRDATQGEFMGRGIYGQYLYIDQERDTVIVVTGADRQFREAGRTDENVDMMRVIARNLRSPE